MQAAAFRRSLHGAKVACINHAVASASASSSSLRTLATSARVRADTPPSATPKKGGSLLQSVLYGSEKAKAEAPAVPGDGSHPAAGAGGGGQQYSAAVGRGKYVHEIYRHKVKPGRVAEYRKLIEQYYVGLAKNPEFDIKLTGSWEVVVGDLDTFYHIWEHSGYHGYDIVVPQLEESKEYQDFHAQIAPLLDTRTSQLVQEFSFWPSSPPKTLGGIYEMRIYTMKPGTLLEWEQEWRVGLEARKQFVEPIAAFFSQVGELHQVIHMWHYESMETRKMLRQKAWEVDTWSNTVAKTVKLTSHMQAQILKPLPFSPLK